MIVGVIGSGDPAHSADADAMEVGRLLAAAGAKVVCGGLSGIMQAVCRGASEAGGTTLGILPSENAASANPYVDIPIPTGMGVGRNVLVVRTAHAVIAMRGSWGTLSEIALALNIGKPVVDLGSWGLEGSQHAAGPAQAVEKALELARGHRKGH